ncbi:glycosyltransferase [Aliarcobacter butzleri]|uniref:glycosyltransferase n=1 Tax=Aliarcobacter butzleri TaxID=28197 RepID=UPI003AF44287
MNKQVKISLIMPNFNGAKTIESSILSVINNEYSNKELVIVDGKSTDESHVIIQKYTEKYDFIKWIDIKDRGISDAINIGLEKTTGDIIGYLGSDDLLNTETLFKINNSKQLVDFDAIYFDSYTYYIDKNIIQLRKCPNVIFNRVNLIKYGTLVGLQNIFFDKKVFDEIKYDINNKYSMDYEIYFRIVERFSNFMYIEYPAAINKFENNISHKLAKLQIKEALNSMYKYVTWKDLRYLPFKRIIISYVK